MLLKDKSQCYKCHYCWFPEGMAKFLETPMCLYYHDTGNHRENNEFHCKSFVPKSKRKRSEISLL